MDDKLLKAAGLMGVSIMGLAFVAIIVSKKSNTAGIASAVFGGFDQMLSAVTGGFLS